MALGLAVGGKMTLAEQSADRTSGSGAGAMDVQHIGGITAAAMAHVYDAEGRVSSWDYSLRQSHGCV